MTKVREFTASVYILERSKILLIFHKKLKKWLPPGGHLQPNELPLETAIREAKEETGLEIELISQENIWIEKWNAESFERPYLCLLEHIPESAHEKAHQHIDFVYLAKPLSTNLILNTVETEGIKWFTSEELDLLEKDVEIFEETFLVAKKILTHDTAFPSYPKYARE